MNVRFVTGNLGKAAEAQARLGALGVHVEPVDVKLPEIQSDILGDVAVAKAEAARGRVAPPYFVEDAGLLVETLRGFPGVYSAQAFRTIGNEGLLRLLSDARDRSASFRAVVAYVDGPRPPRMFTGDIHGRIARTPRGHNGFGFDPIFVPEGHRRTFAQMGPEEKNRLSHRARALDRLARHLRRAR